MRVALQFRMWDSQGEVQHVTEHSRKATSPTCKMSVKKNIKSLVVILVLILELKNSFAVKVLLYQAV